MSTALDQADTIRNRLLTAPAAGELETAIDLTALTVIVDRQKNILSDITKAVAKVKGTAIVILWNGWATIDKKASRPRLAHRYTISVYSKPIIAGDDLPADSVMESIIARIWHWIPEGVHVLDEAEVGNGGLVGDPKFLIYDVEITVPTSH